MIDSVAQTVGTCVGVEYVTSQSSSQWRVMLRMSGLPKHGVSDANTDWTWQVLNTMPLFHIADPKHRCTVNDETKLQHAPLLPTTLTLQHSRYSTHTNGSQRTMSVTGENRKTLFSRQRTSQWFHS
jgi:hypothetical protein